VHGFTQMVSVAPVPAGQATQTPLRARTQVVPVGHCAHGRQSKVVVSAQ
jgi:hypothetical protein